MNNFSNFNTGSVISKDKTVIGYRQTGRGKGIIVCHGGGRISQNYEKLATALSTHFTVYIPDRRGRGLSGAAGDQYDIKRAAEDLAAVINATGAEYIFGHSAGALIALETMLSHPLKKMVLYEPPISVNGSLPSGWLPDFENAVSKGQFKKAMAISLKGLQVHEGINKMSQASLIVMLSVITLIEKKKEQGTRMLDLISTLSVDMKMAIELDSKYDRFAQINTPILLMTGSKSPSYFHEGIHALEGVLPAPTTKFFEGFDHYSPEEKGKEIAEAIVSFINDVK